MESAEPAPRQFTARQLYNSTIPNGSVCADCRAALPESSSGRKESAECFRKGHFARLQMHRIVAPDAHQLPQFSHFVMDDVIDEVAVCTLRNDGSNRLRQMPGYLRIKIRFLEDADAPDNTLHFWEQGMIVPRALPDLPFAVSSLKDAEADILRDLNEVPIDFWAAMAGTRYTAILRRTMNKSVSEATRQMIMDGFHLIILCNWLMGTGGLVGAWAPQARLSGYGMPFYRRLTVPPLVSGACNWILDRYAQKATDKLFGDEGSFTRVIGGRDPTDAEGLLLFNSLLAAHLSDFLLDRRSEDIYADAACVFTQGESVELVMRSVNMVSSLIQDWGLRFAPDQLRLSKETKEFQSDLAAAHHELLKSRREDWTEFWEMPPLFYVDWNRPSWTPVATYLHEARQTS